jgi:hypothetical protein
MKTSLIAFLLMMIFQARGQVRLYITIKEGDTHKITPAMLCITGLGDSAVYTPPGIIAPEATYPDTFFTGIAFNEGRNFTGPVRRMTGKGAVNGQRTYVYGDAPTLPYWSDSVMYQTTGNFFLDLPAGKYRISIEHGPEYIPVTAIINLRQEQKQVRRQFILKRWINMPALGWYSGDVHTHHPLNTLPFRKYMMQMAEAANLHLVNVLEMGDRSHVYFPPWGFGEKYYINKNDFSIVAGQEEPRSIYGHVIGLNTDTFARDTAQYNYYDIVFNRLHKRPSALTGFAHFAYKGEGVTPGLAMYAPTGAVDFVELMQNTKINTEDYYDYLNLGFHFAAAYGSDFPWGSSIGDGRVFVYTGKRFSARKWFAGLKAGNSFVSNGPAVFLKADNKIPGNEIIKDSGSFSFITLKALCSRSIGIIDKIQLIGSDGLLLENTNTGNKDSVQLSFHHKVVKSQWVAAFVHCTNGAIAHTSPVYFIVDGKSTYNKTSGPGIIKKLTAILLETRRTELANPVPDSGILLRIDEAIHWYNQLLSN